MHSIPCSRQSPQRAGRSLAAGLLTDLNVLRAAGFQAAVGKAMSERRAALLEQLAASEACSEQSEVLSVAIEALVALKKDRSSGASSGDAITGRSRSMCAPIPVPVCTPIPQ